MQRFATLEKTKGLEMKITITIPDSAVADVREYCRVTGTDLQGRMQQELDAFVANALCQMKQHIRISRDIDNFQEAIKKTVNAE